MNVVISGYYGFDNAGDEAVLTAVAAALRGLCPGLRLTALSARPERTARRHGVEAVPRLSFAAVRRALRAADLFISGGGSLLQDATGWGSVPYYGGLMLWARRMGVPVVVYAQGIGPLRRPLLRRWVGHALAAAAAVTVRDAMSAAEARALGVPPQRLAVTADPVFALACDGAGPVSRHAQRLLGSLPDGPIVGLSLRPPLRGAAAAGAAGSRPETVPILARQLAAALRSYLPAWGARALALPLYPAQDEPLLTAVQSSLGPLAVPWPAGADPTEFSPRDWLAVFRRIDLCLTMRLHGLIFAACAGTPCVVWGDDPKLAGHVDELGLPRERFFASDLEHWVDAAASLWPEREQWRHAVHAGALRLAGRAEATARVALAVARGAGTATKEAFP